MASVVNKITTVANRFLARMQGAMRRIGGLITIDSGVTDSGAVGAGLPRSSILRPGFVLGAGASKFYAASDTTNVTGSTPASITSLIAIGSGAANKTFKFKIGGNSAPEITVTTVTATTTCDALVTLLNANVQFGGQLVADKVATNKLRVRTLRVGRDAYFRITTGTINGQGGSTNDTFADNTESGGKDGDYRVLGLGEGERSDTLDMLNNTLGVVADQVTTKTGNLLAGEFVEANLVGLTPEAAAVLAHRGSTFQ